MAEFLMVMKGARDSDDGGDWGAYVARLLESPSFRGGSSLANGVAVSNKSRSSDCTISGFMRFEADDIEAVMALLAGNPLYEAGGSIEILELVRSE